MNILSMLKVFNNKQNNLEPGLNLPGGPVRDGSYRVVVTLSAALVVVAGLAGYFWYQIRTMDREATVNTESQRMENEANSVIKRVGQLMVLPGDEEPTVATVTDLNALKGQPFFTGAKIGDKVLIYTNAKKAILYDPVANKIVNVAPINLGNQPVLSSQAPSVPQ